MKKFNKKEIIMTAIKASEMSIEGVLGLGKSHYELRKELGKTYQREMVAMGAPELTESQAQELRAVGASAALQNPEFEKHLPSTLRTLRALAPLSVEFMDAAIKAGHVHPGMTSQDAMDLGRMSKALNGVFEANWEPEQKSLVTQVKDMRWRDEMMTGFLRSADQYSDNGLAIAFLNDAIGTDQNNHLSIDEAFAEVKKQVEWVGKQLSIRDMLKKVRKITAEEVVAQ